MIKLQIISQDLSKDELSEQKTVVDDIQVVWSGDVWEIFWVSSDYPPTSDVSFG